MSVLSGDQEEIEREAVRAVKETRREMAAAWAAQRAVIPAFDDRPATAEEFREILGDLPTYGH